MNIAVTDGINLMPPPFIDGLANWSSEDGRPNQPTYATSSNAQLVASDGDFGSCLEINKTNATIKIRWRHELTMMPGVYLKVTARVKQLSGPPCSARIAAYPLQPNAQHAPNLIETGPETRLGDYGRVYEISAIIGPGERQGVDMSWGTAAGFAHFGLDLIGDLGGIIRISDIKIEDATHIFHRKLMSWIDVKDYGAKGDGSTDDRAAFIAADADARGRTLLIPNGTFFIGSDLILRARCHFEGKLDMADTTRFIATNGFDFNLYVNAFGDEVLALKKAIQALITNTDHEVLDLCGRRINLTEPLDIAALCPGVTQVFERRVIQNGEFLAVASSDWDTETVTTTASYSASNPIRLTNVNNIESIKKGSLVTGNGVGREVYVRSVNVDTATITLSQSLYQDVGTQSFTFQRFKYMLDFSGIANMMRFNVINIEFLARNQASCIILPDQGMTFSVTQCYFNKPKDRCITSAGRGCTDIHVDQCEFICDEYFVRPRDRKTVAININANDVKVRNNNASGFRHTVVFSGSGGIFTGNHFWQGDPTDATERLGSIVLTERSPKSSLTGNYIDNSYIEMSNEHSLPQETGGWGFGSITITGNFFTANDIDESHRYIVLKPHGPSNYISGFTVTDNVFMLDAGRNIERVDGLDETMGTMDRNYYRNITFTGNTFVRCNQITQNPLWVSLNEPSASGTWETDELIALPFDGMARSVVSCAARGEITNSSGQFKGYMPAFETHFGNSSKRIQVRWPEAMKGKLEMEVRTDTRI